MKAIVISGGGARAIQGFALLERHLRSGADKPDLLVGTSAGGLVAALFAHCGLDGARNELLSIRNQDDVFSGQLGWGIHKLGVMDSKPLQKRLERVFKNKPIIPYYVCSLDLLTCKPRYLSYRDGWWAVASTGCIPLLVNPQVDSKNGLAFCDGGVIENLPLKFPIERGASRIEVIMCSAKDGDAKKPMPRTKIGFGLRVLEAMRNEIARDDVSRCLRYNALPEKRQIRVNITYPSRNYLDILEFHRMREAYLALQ